MATFNGTTGSDEIDGSVEPDELFGDAGDDKLYGHENDDALYGESGDDTLSGDSGDDKLFGGQGDDAIFGGPGSDTLQGGEGNDQLDGGEGSDAIYGGAGDDTVFSGDDEHGDQIGGGDGNDVFYAGAGDSVDGGAGGTDQDVLDLSNLGHFNITNETVDDDGNSTSGTVELFDEDGNLTDTLEFSEIETIIMCFCAGTMIETCDGPRSVETLGVGDMVPTLDHGDQPIRWIGHRTVAATGTLAPIKFSAGALGNSTDLWVSPQHRMLVQDWRAELLFGDAEVLAPAKSLVNGDTITRAPGGEVRYVHLLFDRHELISAHGVYSESFHPGERVLDAMAADSRDELLTLFPELRDHVFGPSARRSLMGFETALLLSEIEKGLQND